MGVVFVIFVVPCFLSQARVIGTVYDKKKNKISMQGFRMVPFTRFLVELKSKGKVKTEEDSFLESKLDS